MHLCHSQSSLHSSCHSDQFAASLADCFTVVPHLDKPGSSIRETTIFRAITWLRDLMATRLKGWIFGEKASGGTMQQLSGSCEQDC